MAASDNGGEIEITLTESLSAGELKDSVAPLPDSHASPAAASPFLDHDTVDGTAPGTPLTPGPHLTPGLSRQPSVSLRTGLPECQGLLVAFKDLTYTVKAKKETLTLLDSLTGFFKPGEMTALMGPSGSGKTTLLDVLAGRKTAGTTSGKVTYGNEPPTKAFLRRHTGYVEQFDTLVENMTVREMILYTAQMKLPHTMPKADKVKATEEIMDRLGLSRARDTLIGGQNVKGISGGQAKRVNIAVSLITDPYVLYLDEPTSGLDSFTADEVMQFVKSFVSTGITICATIHSPSPKTFELFDSLGLLVQGRMVYFGRNLRPATDYFYNHRLTQEPFVHGTDFPAEWLVTLVTAASKEGKDEIMRFSDTYQRSLAPSVSKALEAELAAVSGSDGSSTGIVAAATNADSRAKFATNTPVWWALLIYFKYRSFKNFKDPLFLSARIVDKLIVVSIVASLFHGQAHKGRDDCDIRNISQASAFLFMWAATPMFSAAAYLPTFMLERALFRRERSDGIFNVVTYYAAKWIEEIIVAIPVTLIFSAIVYFAVGLAGNFFFFWIIWLITVFTSIALAFCFAMLSPTLDFANGSVPSYGGTLLYFMGYLISLKDIPVWWIWYSYLDFLRFTFVGLMTNEFKGYGTTVPINCNSTVVIPVTGDNILGTYGIYNETAYANLGFLCIFMVVFAGGALFLLKFLKYGSR